MVYAAADSELSAYANDHQLYSSNKGLPAAIDEVEKDRAKTLHLYKSNFLEGNYSKYQVLLYGCNSTCALIG